MCLRPPMSLPAEHARSASIAWRAAPASCQRRRSPTSQLPSTWLPDSAGTPVLSAAVLPRGRRRPLRRGGPRAQLPVRQVARFEVAEPMALSLPSRASTWSPAPGPEAAPRPEGVLARSRAAVEPQAPARIAASSAAPSRWRGALAVGFARSPFRGRPLRRLGDRRARLGGLDWRAAGSPTPGAGRSSRRRVTSRCPSWSRRRASRRSPAWRRWSTPSRDGRSGPGAPRRRSPPCGGR